MSIYNLINWWFIFSNCILVVNEDRYYLLNSGILVYKFNILFLFKRINLIDKVWKKCYIIVFII